GQRDIPGGALQLIDRHTDEGARTADQLRDDVVAERQREGEDGAGGDAGNRQRQDDAPEGLAGMGAEIRRGFDEGARHALERGLDGQHHVGKPDVDEGDAGADVGYRERRTADDRQLQDPVENAAEPDQVEEPGDDAFLGQDQLPGIDADEIVRP